MERPRKLRRKLRTKSQATCLSRVWGCNPLHEHVGQKVAFVLLLMRSVGSAGTVGSYTAPASPVWCLGQQDYYKIRLSAAISVKCLGCVCVQCFLCITVLGSAAVSVPKTHTFLGHFLSSAFPVLPYRLPVLC